MKTVCQSVLSISARKKRYSTDVAFISGNTKVMLRMLIDTGAHLTVVPMVSLHKMCEILPVIGEGSMCGAVREVSCRVCAIKVPMLCLGDITLLDKIVFCTPDERVQDAVLGMDILEGMDIVHRQNSNILTLRGPVENLYVTNRNVDEVLEQYVTLHKID